MTLLVDRPPEAVSRGGKKAAWRADPDVALMLRVQRDDVAAFAELIDRYRTRLFANFVRRVSDRQEAEDLTQEVFLRLYRNRKRYRPRARLATWLYHISHNLACNALRSRSHRVFVPLCHEQFEKQGRSPRDGSRAASDTSPSRQMERAELGQAVRLAVGDLAGRQRTAIELHQFQDRTYAQVAVELDMTPKAAKSLLYRARNHLRASLTGFFKGDE